MTAGLANRLPRRAFRKASRYTISYSSALLAGFAAIVAASIPARAADRLADPIAGQTLLVAASAAVQKPETHQDPELTDAELADYRGGQNVVIGNQTLTSNTSGNTIYGSYAAGSINVSNSAFSNFNGIGNFAINTGAQVSLQSAMNLTINVSP